MCYAVCYSTWTVPGPCQHESKPWQVGIPKFTTHSFHDNAWNSLSFALIYKSKIENLKIDPSWNGDPKGREQKPPTVRGAEPFCKVPTAGLGLKRICSIHDIVPHRSHLLQFTHIVALFTHKIQPNPTYHGHKFHLNEVRIFASNFHTVRLLHTWLCSPPQTSSGQHTSLTALFITNFTQNLPIPNDEIHQRLKHNVLQNLWTKFNNILIWYNLPVRSFSGCI